MNQKLKKTIKIIAAGLFLIALALNIGIMLTDPFSSVSSEALAQTTGSSSSSSSGNSTSAGSSGSSNSSSTDWRTGYSWGQQPRLGSTSSSTTVTMSITFDNSGKASFTVGGSNGNSTTIVYIDCCNPSNQFSSCNRARQNINCINS